MFIRCAFFQGNVKPGKEQAFNDYIRKELVPLWTRFPGAQEVRVLQASRKRCGRSTLWHGVVCALSHTRIH